MVGVGYHEMLWNGLYLGHALIFKAYSHRLINKTLSLSKLSIVRAIIFQCA